VPGSPRALLALATPRRHQSPDYFRRIAGAVYGGDARRDPDALLHGSIARFSEAPSICGYWDIHVTGAGQVSALPPESAWEGWIPA
jgi:hypothetical protein